MNKKITVRNDEGKVRYCVLSGERDLERQFNKWYFGSESADMGYKVNLDSHEFSVVDYYVGETRVTFEVLGIDDTEEDIIEAWVDPETNKTGWL